MQWGGDFKKRFLEQHKNGNLEYGEGWVNGYDGEGNHIFSQERSGAGNWVTTPGFEPEAPCDIDMLFCDQEKVKERRAAEKKTADEKKHK